MKICVIIEAPTGITSTRELDVPDGNVKKALRELAIKLNGISQLKPRKKNAYWICDWYEI